MINFQTVGKPKNPPILFLHGFLGSGKDWLEIANSLRGSHFCILPDLPGHGKNPVKIPAIENGFDFTANQIVKLLDSLKIEKASMAGYSMGGRIALFTALKFPVRFLNLILESANPGLENEIENRKRWESVIISLLNNSPFSEFLEYWYNMPIFKTLQNDPAQLKKMIKERLQNNPAGLAETFEKLALSKQPNLWKKLERLQMPALLISGSLDEKYVEINLRAAHKIPNCQHKIIENAGHNTHFENNKDLSQAIASFLKNNKSC